MAGDWFTHLQGNHYERQYYAVSVAGATVFHKYVIPQQRHIELFDATWRCDFCQHWSRQQPEINFTSLKASTNIWFQQDNGDCGLWDIEQNFTRYLQHYSDLKMGAIASQITSLTIVYSTVYSGAVQRKHQSSASLACVTGDRWFPRTNGQ